MLFMCLCALIVDFVCWYWMWI